MFYNHYNFSDKLDNLNKLQTAELKDWLALIQVKMLGVKSLLFILGRIDELSNRGGYPTLVQDNQ